MLLSMTGFGRAETVFEGKKLAVDLKSLNSKNFDLNLRLPARYRELEFEIRKSAHDYLQRGKVDIFINLESLDGKTDTLINAQVIRNYMDQLKELSPEATPIDLLRIAVKLPEAVSTQDAGVSEEEAKALLDLAEDAFREMRKFRETEGRALQAKLKSYVDNIEQYLGEVAPYEQERMAQVKERLNKSIREFENIDETRFYQEVAYYGEKLDITEEKVRLAQHCKYYKQVLAQEDGNGKKLGFIAQEMGREINTLGSKANHQEIQKLVVKMKDELEKIKEQTLNVL